MFHVGNIVERSTALDLLQHSLDFLAQGLLANLLQVFGKTLAEDDLHRALAFRRKNLRALGLGF